MSKSEMQRVRASDLAVFGGSNRFSSLQVMSDEEQNADR